MSEQVAYQDGGVIYMYSDAFRHGVIDSIPMEYCKTTVKVGGKERRCTCGQYLLRRERNIGVGA